VGGVWVSDTAFDTSALDGVRITPDGNAHSIFFNNCWASSGAQVGVTIAGTGNVREISFDQFRSLANGYSGFRINGPNATNISISDSSVGSNGHSNEGTFPGILLDGGPSHITIANTYIGPLYYYQPGGNVGKNNYGIQIGTGGADALVLTGNQMRDYTVAWMGGADLIGSNAVITDNVGTSTAGNSLDAVTVASAVTITLGTTAAQVYKITGTIAIQTINPAWKRRSITLIFVTAAPGGLATGGNIARAQTVVQNQSINLVFDGSVWY
jgi:hypothetical protein